MAREHRAARWFAGTLTFVGWGALLLAAVGMLTVMHLWVSGLLPELGLRRAVGARRRHVIGRIVVRALAVVGGGAALAWWLEPLVSAAVARAVAQAPVGGLTLVSVPLLAMLGTTLAATIGPAWRAARAAPATLPGFTDL
jgi:putative ABC transport system permease protein